VKRGHDSISSRRQAIEGPPGAIGSLSHQPDASPLEASASLAEDPQQPEPARAHHKGRRLQSQGHIQILNAQDMALSSPPSASHPLTIHDQIGGVLDPV
jgi:hypothetical protein